MEIRDVNKMQVLFWDYSAFLLIKLTLTAIRILVKCIKLVRTFLL